MVFVLRFRPGKTPLTLFTSGTQQDFSTVQQQLQRIEGSGALGTSDKFVKLLRYLAEAAKRGLSPHEIDIAVDVFGKSPSFNAAEDSTVRVYVHKLRRKLENYYSSTGRNEAYRLELPKGSYRLLVRPRSSSAIPSLARNRYRAAIAVVTVLLLASAVWNVRLVLERQQMAPDIIDSPSETALWSDTRESEDPILIVLGDFFFYAESDGPPGRYIRDVRIDSAEELLAYESALGTIDVRPVDITYLPKGVAVSLRYLFRVIEPSDRRVSMKLASDMTGEDIRNNTIVFLGLPKSLGALEDYFFAASRFSKPPENPVFVEDDSGEKFIASDDPDGPTLDYALFAKLPGPEGKGIFIFSALHDIGLMHIVRALTGSSEVDSIQGALAQDSTLPAAFEVLYEVSGYDRADLDARIVRVHAISAHGAQLTMRK